MAKSGLSYDYGIGFWGPNGYDGVWHLSLIQNLSRGSFENPVLSDYSIQNYHLGYDILLAIFHNFLAIDISILYFQIFPLLTSVLTGLLTLVFVYIWTKNIKSSILSLFFVFFAGSAAWMWGRGESAFWSMQAISTLINPSFGLSLPIILTGLIYLVIKNDKLKFIDILVVSLIFSSLFLIKVYAGLLLLFGLFIIFVYRLLVFKDFQYFKLFILTFALALLFYVPLNYKSASLMLWQPFWYLETLFAVGDRMPWPKMAEAMFSYKQQGPFLKFILSYGFALLFFVFGNFWTRLVFVKDLFVNLKNYKGLDTIYLLIVSIIFASILVPTFFVQKGTPWNTIQFTYYGLFLSSILAGISLSKMKNLVLVIVLFLTIPTTIITLKDVYITNRPPAMISNYEYQALEFLKSQEDGIVLTYPYDLEKQRGKTMGPPEPLRSYTFTSYVSAYSAKQQFFEKTNLDIMSYEYRQRFEDLKSWYVQDDKDKATSFLEENNIRYIYWVNGQRALLGDKQLKLNKIFENQEVIIYEYVKDFSRN